MFTIQIKVNNEWQDYAKCGSLIEVMKKRSQILKKANYEIRTINEAGSVMETTKPDQGSMYELVAEEKGYYKKLDN